MCPDGYCENKQTWTNDLCESQIPKNRLPAGSGKKGANKP